MRVRLLVALAALIAGAVLPAFAADAQDPIPVVKLTFHATSRGDEDVLQVDVSIENVKNLGQFAFVMAYSGDLVTAAPGPVLEGDFLPGSGHLTSCPAAAEIEPYALRVQCSMLGALPGTGSSGSGVLASLYFVPRRSGSVDFVFSRTELATPEGNLIAATWESGSFRVEVADTFDWLRWTLIAVGPMVVFVAIAALILRRRKRSVRQGGAGPIGREH